MKNYKKYSEESKKWFEDNFEKIKQLFENKTIRDFIFEPFIDVFKVPDNTIDKDIYSIITQVAIINAILAGLPGQMGVGVYVSMALEAWMAYAIAQHIGVKVKEPSDIFKYFGFLSAVGFTILFGFKHLLSFGFSLFSVVPGINPLILSELFVTNFVGVLFWVGFKEVKKVGKFSIPTNMLFSIGKKTKQIFSYQFKVMKKVLTVENIKLFSTRLKSWFSGDFVVNTKIINGELFATTAMMYLISGNYEKLQGTLGKTFLDAAFIESSGQNEAYLDDTFIEAIRLRWSSQFDANTTIKEMGERFSEYSPESLAGAISTIKGKMFEIMVVNAENNDNDSWQAKMHDDESFPGSDIVFSNSETGEQIDISLKATGAENTSIIEHALDKYPDKPIMATDEAAALYADNPQVFGSGFTNEELQNITEERVDELIDSIESLDATHVVIGGVTFGTFAAAWPFTMAYLRKKITYDDYERALVKILGDSGVLLASRLSYALVLGPIFAWYLLARGIDKIVSPALDTNFVTKKVLVKY